MQQLIGENASQPKKIGTLWGGGVSCMDMPIHIKVELFTVHNKFIYFPVRLIFMQLSLKSIVVKYIIPIQM